MEPHAAAAEPDPRSTLQDCLALKRADRFEDLAALHDRLPRPLDRAWLPVADEVSFALGHLRRTDSAARLLEEAFALEPTHRRASGLAYLYYDAALAQLRPGKGGEKGPSKEVLRKGFRRWIGEALRLRPDSIKDLYRLGVFEAQVESRHDVPALRAFLSAIEAFRAMSQAEQALRGDLRKACTKSLFAGGRSALRLDKLALARKLSFACIREDKDTDHVDPVHKLHLAAKVCLATGEYDHAERAARLALDAKGPPRRDYLFGLLAEIALGRKDPKAAAAWVEQVRPQRRDASLWRLLGDARLAAGDPSAARNAWMSALQRDRGGRHLTLDRLGEVALSQGKAGEAKHHFEAALHFRRKQYASDDARASAGLAKALEILGAAQGRPGLAKAAAPPPAPEQRDEADGNAPVLAQAAG
jgi:tetratricopeptide (TPR) repeat protein